MLLIPYRQRYIGNRRYPLENLKYTNSWTRKRKEEYEKEMRKLDIDSINPYQVLEIPENATDFHEEKDGKKFAKVVKTMWFTNVDHGRRYKPMRELMTEQDVIKFQTGEPFVKYDNYNAIEVSKIKHIPSDYDGIMGVPVSFLSQHCKDQFEIVGSNRGVNQDPNGVYGKSSYIDGKEVFKRLFIRHKK